MSDCYKTGYTCQVVDNHLFTSPNNIYENILNAAEGCCVNVSNLKHTSKFTRTFAENDPYRKLAAGLPASDAGFEDKIDGHRFQPEVCGGFSSMLNTDTINLYDYPLPAMSTQYSTLTSDAKSQSIDDKREKTKGELIIRNTQSSIIGDVKDTLPTLRALPEIYNNIVDFDIIVDHAIIYTTDTIYIEKLAYNYTTGLFDPSSTMPITVIASPDRRSTIIKPFFNEPTNTIVFGRTVVHKNTITPELYKYNIKTGSYHSVYGAPPPENDLNRLRLPDDIVGKFVISSINSTHLSYNELLHKYTVTCTGRLSATGAELARAANINDSDDQYSTDIFFIGVYNFTDTQAGFQYLDSIIYHPHNKREYTTEVITSTKSIKLSSTPVISIGNITDPRSTISLDPSTIPTREFKLKEIRYTYNNKTTTKSRLPINDIGYANITDITKMVESYVPHTSGGATDFASPRYSPVDFNLNLNLDEISVVTISIECVYYDNHRIHYKVIGESRPLPLGLLFEDINVVDTVSYATDNNPSMLKVMLETKNPQYITEILIDNNGIGVDEQEYTFADALNKAGFEFSDLLPEPTPTPTPTPTSP